MEDPLPGLASQIRPERGVRHERVQPHLETVNIPGGHGEAPEAR